MYTDAWLLGIVRRFLYEYLANLLFICLPRDKPRQILEEKKMKCFRELCWGWRSSTEVWEADSNSCLEIRNLYSDLKSRENPQMAYLSCLSVSISLDLTQISDSVLSVCSQVHVMVNWQSQKQVSDGFILCNWDECWVKVWPSLKPSK